MKTVKLRDITTLITKGTTPTSIGSQFIDEGINFIKAESVTLDGQINESIFAHIDEATHQRLRRSQLAAGDILFSIAGMKLGKSAVVRESHLPANTNQALAIIRPDRTRVLPEYLHYYFLNPSHYELVNRITAQSAQPNINLEQVGQLSILLPPLPIQRRIAGILSAYDNLIENCERRIRVLDEMARALYREWFVHFRYPGHENVELVDSKLGRIPKGWEVRGLISVANLTMGQSPKSEFYNQHGDGLPFHQGVTNFGARYPTNQVYCSANARTAEAGDILFSVRAPVGRMNIAREKLALGRGLSAIRHREGHQEFLWEQLRAQFIREDMIGNGAIFAAVTKKEMEVIQLVAPETNVIRNFTRRVKPIHDDIAILDASIANLRQTRDLLLPRLLSGQLSVEKAA